MDFTRNYTAIGPLDKALKAAKTLAVDVVYLSALGTWRSLQPQAGGDYTDWQGPFGVKRGIGPAFIRDDGTEVFMLDETSMVRVTFRVALVKGEH